LFRFSGGAKFLFFSAESTLIQRSAHSLDIGDGAVGALMSI